MVREDIVIKTMDIPAANVLLILLTSTMSFFGVLPSTLVLAVLMAFSIPSIINYGIAIVRNKHMKFRNILLLLAASGFIYIYSTFDLGKPLSLYIHGLFFLFAAGFGVLIYVVFYSINKIVGKMVRRKLSIRERFVSVFIPTFVIGMMVSLVMNMVIGIWLMGLEALL